MRELGIILYDKRGYQQSMNQFRILYKFKRSELVQWIDNETGLKATFESERREQKQCRKLAYILFLLLLL